MPENDEPVEYDLTDWTNQARALLSRCLDGEEISHDWVAGTLQVDPHHEERVDVLVDEIDELAGAESGDGTESNEAGSKVVVIGGDDVMVEPETDDDDSALLDEDDDLDVEDADADADAKEAAVGDQIGYDNDEWDSGTRAMLSSLLRSELIPFVWEATSLVVNSQDEARVDVLVEQVEVYILAPLDPSAPKVVYELDGWSDEQRAALAGELLAAAISHDWDDEENLVVHEEDEAAVDPMVDVIDDGTLEADDDEDGEVDGLAAQEAMSDLFLAADRLLHDPTDGGAVAKLSSAVNRVEVLPVPYGFSPPEWQRIVDRSAELREMVSEEDADDADDADEIEEIDDADEIEEIESDEEADEDLGDAVADPEDNSEGEAAKPSSRSKKGRKAKADGFDEEAVVEAATALRNMLRSFV